jgi:hypothetical protein
MTVTDTPASTPEECVPPHDSAAQVAALPLPTLAALVARSLTARLRRVLRRAWRAWARATGARTIPRRPPPRPPAAD